MKLDLLWYPYLSVFIRFSSANISRWLWIEFPSRWLEKVTKTLRGPPIHNAAVITPTVHGRNQYLEREAVTFGG